MNNEYKTYDKTDTSSSILGEPSVAYGYVASARNGLNKNNLINLKNNTGLDYEVLATLLDINTRTIQKRKIDEPFKLNTSEKMIAIAELYANGFETFGDKEKFKKWMNYPLPALGGATPLSMLDTHYGIQMVTDVIGRIKYGIYS
ncbi:MAG: MbcA/ParS/Xre antitoxin family protein [Bacteroidota bacterium]|nr:MbcA/ParS/Xre antitoxin family protein [Bacteroidota bacterium]